MKTGAKLLLPLITSAFIFLTLQNPSTIYARSGCCSHHGGVCGCGCCDGSPLSDTCAPYYPQCNQQPTYIAPIKTPKPYIKPLQTESPILFQTPTPTIPTPVAYNSNRETEGFTEGIGIVTLGIIGGIYYLVKKNKK